MVKGRSHRRRKLWAPLVVLLGLALAPAAHAEVRAHGTFLRGAGNRLTLRLTNLSDRGEILQFVRWGVTPFGATNGPPTIANTTTTKIGATCPPSGSPTNGFCQSIALAPSASMDIAFDASPLVPDQTGGNGRVSADGMTDVLFTIEGPAPLPTKPTLIPLLGNDSADPAIQAKRVAHQLAQEDFDIANKGGALSFLGNNKNLFKAIGLAGKSKTVGVFFGIVGSAISVVGDATSAEYNVAGAIEELWAQDPPASDYTVLAAPARLPGLHVKPGAKLPRGIAAAADRVFKNAAQTASVARAFLLSFERGEGAYNAGNGHWEKLQAQAAAGFARAEAMLIDAAPGLNAALAAAAQRAGAQFGLPADKEQKLLRYVGAHDTGPGALSPLARFGLSAAEIEKLRAGAQRALSSAPGRKLNFLDLVSDRRVAAHTHAFAAALRKLSTRLSQIAAALAG
jgi:hypothetical protein